MVLGSLDKVSLGSAHKKAKEAHELVGDDIDPIEHKKAAVVAAAWRNAKQAARWSSTLEACVYLVFGHLPVDAIDTNLVCKVLKPIWPARLSSRS